MMSDVSGGDGKIDRSTLLAEERTLVAADLTLMAWIRTSLSMISFGFTIYKFLQAFAEAEHFQPVRPNAPRNLGLALCTVGTVAMAAAIVQHFGFVKRLQLLRSRSPWSLSVYVAIFITLIGILALVGMVMRSGPF